MYCISEKIGVCGDTISSRLFNDKLLNATQNNVISVERFWKRLNELRELSEGIMRMVPLKRHEIESAGMLETIRLKASCGDVA